MYTAINVIGLSVGIAAALLIFRMVNHELSFNKNFQHYDRIVRVVSVQKNSEEGESHSVCTPIPAMDAIESTVSQFEQMSRVRELWSTLTIPNPAGGAPLKKFGMTPPETAFFVTPGFFKIFDFQWLSGDPATALQEPGSIVLTRSWAEKCFGTWETAINKTVLIDNLISVTVKGVVVDLPDNCDFPIPFLVSYPTLKAHPDYFFYDNEWGSCSSNNQVYALLNSPSQLDAANEVLAKVGEKEYSKANGWQDRFHQLQPLSDLHYNEQYGHSGSHQTAKSRLKVLAAIGILILIMACFNFINLATAQASLRAKEVGVRKTLGGQREQLVVQFMSETGLIVLVAVVLGGILASMCTPLLKYVSNVPDTPHLFQNTLVWLFLAALLIGVTLLAGLYPALALASFKPIKALKNNLNNHFFGGASIRKSLVVLQFIIAQGLIIGAIIAILQLDFIRSQDLGFNNELVYTFNFNSDSTTISRQNALKEGLIRIPSVISTSFSSDQPLSGNTWSSNFRYASRPEDEKYGINLKFCDENYMETYGITLLAGRWLQPSDTMREAVVNMTLLRKLGISDPTEVLGQNIRQGSRRLIKIVGVAKDFHTHDFRTEHEPMMMSTRKEYYWEAGVKIRGGDITATTNAIKGVFDEVLPEQVFTGNFLDESIARFYENDNRLASTCKAFGLLAILISCLGLFGLATHAAAQRKKEIGVRKVLGATVVGIVGLLSKDFLKLVFIALLLASPLAWYVMNTWLQNFAYRIAIPWWVFLLAGITAILIATLTVSYQSVKAALVNPVESLYNE